MHLAGMHPIISATSTLLEPTFQLRFQLQTPPTQNPFPCWAHYKWKTRGKWVYLQVINGCDLTD